MSDSFEKKVICIFVSSTFIDMEVERDIINNVILNQLREDFAEMNTDIHFIDLRWGINTIDVADTVKRNEKILKVCISEIERCNPYFIGLFGKRYGWTPDNELLYSCILKDDMERCKRFFSNDDISVTALETYYALIKKDFEIDKCFICQRDENVYSSIPSEIRDNYIDTEHKQEIDNFQKRIISYFESQNKSSHLISYGGEWDKLRFKPEESFYEQLYQGLHNAIAKDLNRELSFKNEIERENYYQNVFIERTSRDTIVREQEIRMIETSLDQEESGKILLHAASGQGKSTVLCQLYDRLRGIGKYEVIFYSAAASIKSGSMINLIESFAYRLAVLLGKEYETIEKKYDNRFSTTDFWDYTSLIGKGGTATYHLKETMSYDQQILTRLLKYVSEYRTRFDKQLVFLIDAYDRFEYSSLLHSLEWLNALDVSVIMTTLSEIADSDDFLPQYRKIALPGFTKEEALQFIKINSNGKELHNNVVHTILDIKDYEGHYAYASPLWLKLIVHVLTSLDITDFHNIAGRTESDKEERIHNYMQDLINQVPTQPGEALLYFINKCETYIGRAFSAEVLQLLAFSEYGLREQDLEKLMGERWSHLDFALLHRWIRPYLSLGQESQWQLGHNLFVNTLKKKYDAQKREIYRRLLSHCQHLPETDPLREKMGMLYAIYAQDQYIDAVHYYTFNCRLAQNIQSATDILVNYLRKNPDYLTELTEYVNKKNKAVDNLNNELNDLRHCSDSTVSVNDTKKLFYDYHTAERILFTLGNQLYKQGMNQLLKQLYHFYEQILERAIDEREATTFFLSMIYVRMADIFKNEYNEEMSLYYKEKSKRITEDKKGNSDDISLRYAEIINDLYTQSSKNDIPYVEELFSTEFRNDRWAEDWLDELLHSLGDMYASLSCPVYHQEYSFWKSELPDAMRRYDEVLPEDDSDWEVNIDNRDQSYFFKYNALLRFMEFLCKLMVKEYKAFAMRMQHDCLCLYSSIAKSRQNEYYYDDCALGYALASEFYLNIGETEKAVETNIKGLSYCAYAQNLYPNSIAIRKRFLFANHSLGKCLFNICRYEEALQPLMEYRDGIKEILDGDPKQLTMVSSYLVALETTGRCYLYLKRYDEALDHFDIELKVLRKYMQNAPQSILNSWIEMLYNSKYYIARCYMESGYKELGIKWANGLYHELLDAGCPDDCDFEPMENVRELLGLI